MPKRGFPNGSIIPLYRSLLPYFHYDKPTFPANKLEINRKEEESISRLSFVHIATKQLRRIWYDFISALCMTTNIVGPPVLGDYDLGRIFVYNETQTAKAAILRCEPSQWQ